MKKVKRETAAKMGVFSAIMMIFTSVVGIGIFFKNGTVFRLNNNCWWGILLSWGISIIIILCMALSFGEISSCKMSNQNSGLGGWAQTFCPHPFGRYSKVGYSFAFYSMNTFAVVAFTGEAILNCFAKLGAEGQYSGGCGFDFGRLTPLYIFISGGVIFALLLMANYFSSNAMSKFSKVAGLIKFVPIAMVVILGVTFGVLYAGGGLWTNASNVASVQNDAGDFSWFGMIQSVPAILFSYEGFLSVGNVAGEMRNPKKEVPLSIVLGVAFISILYLLITIGCMTAGNGSVYGLWEKVPNETARSVLTLIMSILIFISLVGTLNALIYSGARAYQSVCSDGTMFKGKSLVNKKPNHSIFAGIIWMGMSVGFWWLVTLIPSAILNTDVTADAPSCVMVVYLYIIYGGTILGGLVNRATHKHETMKIGVFPLTAVISILGSLLVIGFCGIYQFIVLPVQNGITSGWNASYDCGWGMFLKTALNEQGEKTIQLLSNKAILIIFWCMFGVIAIVPFINDMCIKFWDKDNHTRLIWEKERKLSIKKSIKL